MEERKNIAMCISGSMEGVHDEIIRGAFEYCQSRDIRLLLYSSLLSEEEYNGQNGESTLFGESMPFQLVPFDKIDGLIIAGDTLQSEDVIKELVRQARMRGLPVVSIYDDSTTGCFHVNVNDEEGMEQMVRHIVEEHGLTRVNFIAGVSGNMESENRLRAYKHVLEDNHIPVEEQRIGYGLFGCDTERVMERFFDGSAEKPQAIICSNDLMAIRAIRFLNERGYRVPEDIIVTGFDGHEEALNFCPSITTVRREMRETGGMAVKLLTRIWKGKPVALDTDVTPGIIYGQSCGCQPQNVRQTIRMYDYQHEQNEEKLRFIQMVEALLHFGFRQKTLDSYIETIEYTVQDFHISKMMFCMADSAFSHVPEAGQRFIRYPEGLRVAGAYGIAGYRNRRLKPGELPEVLLSEDIVCISFMPVYYRDLTLGYLMMGHTDMEFDRLLFKQWISVVSAQLGTYYEHM